MGKDLMNTLNYQIRRIESFYDTSTNLEEVLEEIEKNISNKQEELRVIQDSSGYYKKSQDILYEKSVGSLKKLIDSALSFIFYDKNYEIIINLEDKRGAKNLNFFLKDLDNDLEVSLKNGCGNGVRSVVSAILNLFVLVNKGSKYLFLDEKYSYISSDYLENFFMFLKKICDDKDITIVIITHDPRFLDYADYTYKVADGYVVSDHSLI